MDKIKKDLLNRDLDISHPNVQEIYVNALEIKDLYGLKSAIKYIDDMVDLYGLHRL